MSDTDRIRDDIKRSLHDMMLWAQECRQPAGGGKGKETNFPLGIPKGNQPCQHLDFIPLRLILGLLIFWTVHGCVLSHFSRVWLFVTPQTVAHQAPLSMGFSSQEYWSGLLGRPPRNLSHPVIKSTSPALQADSLATEPPLNCKIANLCFIKPPFITAARGD